MTAVLRAGRPWRGSAGMCLVVLASLLALGSIAMAPLAVLSHLGFDSLALVAAFSGRLKDAVDLAAVRADLISVTHQALEPAHVAVWLRDGGR